MPNLQPPPPKKNKKKKSCERCGYGRMLTPMSVPGSKRRIKKDIPKKIKKHEQFTGDTYKPVNPKNASLYRSPFEGQGRQPSTYLQGSNCVMNFPKNILSQWNHKSAVRTPSNTTPRLATVCKAAGVGNGW